MKLKKKNWRETEKKGHELIMSVIFKLHAYQPSSTPKHSVLNNRHGGMVIVGRIIKRYKVKTTNAPIEVYYQCLQWISAPIVVDLSLSK